MTHHRASKAGLGPGYAIELRGGPGARLFLPDPADRPEGNTTPCPASALYVEHLWLARLVAMVSEVQTGQKWVPVLIDVDPENPGAA